MLESRGTGQGGETGQSAVSGRISYRFQRNQQANSEGQKNLTELHSPDREFCFTPDLKYSTRLYIYLFFPHPPPLYPPPLKIQCGMICIKFNDVSQYSTMFSMKTLMGYSPDAYTSQRLLSFNPTQLREFSKALEGFSVSDTAAFTC